MGSLVIFFAAPSLALGAVISAGGSCTATDTCEQGYTCGSSGRCVVVSGTNTGITLINPLNAGTSLDALLGGILDIVIRIGTVVVILMIVYVGFLFVAAQGNDAKLIAARKALLWTLVGALILLGAKAIQVGITATVRALGG